MKVQLLPSCLTEPAHQYLTSFRINDRIAIDAGSLGWFRAPQQQAEIRHVFLTHSHIDHLASLPIFVENVYELTDECVRVYGSESVLNCLKNDLFNDRLWPNFLRIQGKSGPFLTVHLVEPNKPITVSGLTLTPISVHHPVPTVAYVIDDGASSVAIITDTGPTQEIWDVVNRAANLKAIFLDLAFPDAVEWLAKVSGHFNTGGFVQELKKLKRDVPVYAIHLKPRSYDEVSAELAAHHLPRVHVVQPGEVYEFGSPPASGAKKPAKKKGG